MKTKTRTNYFESFRYSWCWWEKRISVWKQRLEIEGIETTEENIFIAAACDEKGIAF